MIARPMRLMYDLIIRNQPFLSANDRSLTSSSELVYENVSIFVVVPNIKMII